MARAAKTGPAKEAKSQPAADPGVLRVTGPAAGFWRAGRRFGPEPVDLPLAELPEADRAAIEAEPKLVAVVVAGQAG